MKTDIIALKSSFRERLGLHRLAVEAMPEMWVRRNGDCVPFFAPDLMFRFGGVQLSGGFGIFVQRFEESWKLLLRRSGAPPNFNDTILLGVHIYSVRGFQNPPVFPNDAASVLDGEQTEWLLNIQNLLSKFPSSFSDLEDSFGRQEICSIPIRGFWGHPVKWRAFAEWAKEAGLLAVSDVARQLPVDRIHPYEFLVGNKEFRS